MRILPLVISGWWRMWFRSAGVELFRSTDVLSPVWVQLLTGVHGAGSAFDGVGFELPLTVNGKLDRRSCCRFRSFAEVAVFRAPT